MKKKTCQNLLNLSLLYPNETSLNSIWAPSVSCGTTFGPSDISVLDSIKFHIVSKSVFACVKSRYVDPKKLNGLWMAWKYAAIMTTSPTVNAPLTTLFEKDL